MRDLCCCKAKGGGGILIHDSYLKRTDARCSFCLTYCWNLGNFTTTRDGLFYLRGTTASPKSTFCFAFWLPAKYWNYIRLRVYGCGCQCCSNSTTVKIKCFFSDRFSWIFALIFWWGRHKRMFESVWIGPSYSRISWISGFVEGWVSSQTWNEMEFEILFPTSLMWCQDASFTRRPDTRAGSEPSKTDLNAGREEGEKQIRATVDLLHFSNWAKPVLMRPFSSFGPQTTNYSNIL